MTFISLINTEFLVDRSSRKISFATILVMLQHPGPPGKLVRQESC